MQSAIALLARHAPPPPAPRRVCYLSPGRRRGSRIQSPRCRGGEEQGEGRIRRSCRRRAQAADDGQSRDRRDGCGGRGAGGDRGRRPIGRREGHDAGTAGVRARRV